MKKYLIIFLLITLTNCKDKTLTNNAFWEVTSPNDAISFQLKMQKNGKLSYQVFLNSKNANTEIIEPSSLGIIREDQSFDTLQFIAARSIKTVDESYTLVTGKQLKNKNNYRELTVNFKNSAGSKLDIVVRTYDDGIAFKYVFPENDKKTFTVTKELTEFNIPNSGSSWIQPYDVASAYAPAYERNYEKALPIGTNAPSKEGWAFPALFETKNAWMMLTEANLKENFYASHLMQNCENGVYTITSANPEEGFGYGNEFGKSTLPWEMPWRVVFIGENVGDIVESNLVSHVSDASQIEDTSWIVPGRASWAWWSGYLNNTNDSSEKLRHFIDFAKTMKWEYSMVDAGWESREGLDIPELAKYAEFQGVKLLLWYNSGGPINRVDAGPRDLMFDPEIRKKEMERISKLGVKGIKIDFFGSDKQDYIKLYHDILVDGAKYKLMINFHGCTLPRGWSRTYPNLIAMESVKGSEGYIYHSDFEEKAPVHNVVLAYTRNVVGPMDYTPTAFSYQQFPHKTTFGHELALSVVFESGIQHFPDTPESYLKQPKEVLQFLSDVPSTWETTKFLSGYPGNEIVIARKNNNKWFVGAINADDSSKEIEIDFSFLRAGTFEAEIINDGENKSEFLVKKLEITKKSKEKLSIKPFGGFVITIINKN